MTVVFIFWMNEKNVGMCFIYYKMILNFSWARTWEYLSVTSKLWGTLDTQKIVWFDLNHAFFIFSKFSFLRAWSQFLPKTRLKLWGRLETSKIVSFGGNLTQLILGWISGGCFFIFSKFSFLRAWSQVLAKNEACSLETQKWSDFSDICNSCSYGVYPGGNRISNFKFYNNGLIF